MCSFVSLLPDLQFAEKEWIQPSSLWFFFSVCTWRSCHYFCDIFSQSSNFSLKYHGGNRERIRQKKKIITKRWVSELKFELYEETQNNFNVNTNCAGSNSQLSSLNTKQWRTSRHLRRSSQQTACTALRTAATDHCVPRPRRFAGFVTLCRTVT